MNDKPKLYKWRISGHGRRNGALGISYNFSTEVVAADEQAALLASYEKWEGHAGNCKIVRLGEVEDKT